MESAIGMVAKSHKTAEKCIRLLRKKQRVRAERAAKHLPKVRPIVFLVSWANAQELVTFLEAAESCPAQVVVLCDTNSNRTRAAAQRWSKDFTVVKHVAVTWDEAVSAAALLTVQAAAAS